MKHILSFVAGAAIGSLVTFIFVKTKYERIAQEEIDSVKEVYSKTKERTQELREELRDDKTDFVDKPEYIDEKEVGAYNGIIEHSGYSKYSDRPYTLRPEEFGDLDEYELISLTHYSDGVLTDDNDDKMEDDEIDDTVGADYAEHFGEYEDDSVFVRNDRLKCDFEILYDKRKYSELRTIKGKRL